jgi:hypothetical protein
MTATDLAMEQALAKLAAVTRDAALAELKSAVAQVEAAVLAALVSAEEYHCRKLMEQAVALAASALVEKTCHVTAVHAEVSVGRSLANERCSRELAECATALAVKASTNKKEAASRARNLPAAYMVETVFVVDTWRQEMAGHTRQWPSAAQR